MISIDEQIEQEKAKDEVLQATLEKIEWMRQEGYIKESQRKHKSVLACKERGMTQRKAAEYLGIGSATVIRYWNKEDI